MIKNEIEYMHGKIEGVDPENEEDALLKESKFRFEKVFKTGQITKTEEKKSQLSDNKTNIVLDDDDSK